MPNIKFLNIKDTTYQFYDEDANNKYYAIETEYAYLGEIYDNYVNIVNNLAYRISQIVIPERNYLTIECTEGPLQLDWGMNSYHGNYTKTIEYSTDGVSWTSISSYNSNATYDDGTSLHGRFPLLNEGDKLYLRGNNASYSGDYYSSKIIQTGTGKFKVYGNIMSLFYGGDFKDKTNFPGNSNFNLQRFFSGTNIVDASELKLPAITLTGGCYRLMFQGCTSLTTAPNLPATTLAVSCYESMFLKCTSLTSAQQILPAETLTQSCYESMFEGCTSLITAPELRARILVNGSFNTDFSSISGCCAYMFKGCTNLTTPPSQLLATQLKWCCYYAMFQGCISLENAPELYGSDIRNALGCYQYMFQGCKSLNYIKYKGNINDYLEDDDYQFFYSTALGFSTYSFPFKNWVDGVAQSGTFENKNNIRFHTGNDGIPKGWTIYNYN